MVGFIAPLTVVTLVVVVIRRSAAASGRTAGVMPRRIQGALDAIYISDTTLPLFQYNTYFKVLHRIVCQLKRSGFQWFFILHFFGP